MGRGVVGGRRVVVVTPGAGRPHAGPARDQGQGEHSPGDAQPGRSRAGPDPPSLQHQHGQRAGETDRDQGDPDPGEQVAGIGEREHALLGGQPRVACVQHGVPGQPNQQ